MPDQIISVSLEDYNNKSTEILTLRSRLQAMLDHYLRLANSGDAGNWDPEEEDEVIRARAALKGAKGA